MSNLLSFITSFGSSAQLRNLSRDELVAVMTEHGLSEPEQQAILSGDASRIARIARTPGDIRCCIAPQEPDDGEEEDGDEEQDSRAAQVDR